MMSTATTFSLVKLFLVGACEGLSGRSAKTKDGDTALEIPLVEKSVNTATLNLNLRPKL